MNTKMPAAIEAITLDAATFHGVSVEQPTLINFFYGNNGTGKSTIAATTLSDAETTYEQP